MSRYPINKEFFLYTLLTPPIKTPQEAGKMGEMMKPPKWLWKDKEISVTKETIGGYRGEAIEVFVMEPREIETDNCLVYYHGGGFFFEASGSHYKNAKAYVLKVPCKVIFVQYRLAPKHPFPIPVEDCFEALKWTYENTNKLGINPDKIALGGDSAGGCLAAAVTQMARDRKLGINILFQLLVYPFVDQSMSSESNRIFTDTPVWNSTLSKLMVGGYVQSPDVKNHVYASPIEGSCENLPKAYIETAEFDCLHDDGIMYAEKLQRAGIAVEVNETKGTMHGFDIAQKAPTTQAAVAARIEYMSRMFSNVKWLFFDVGSTLIDEHLAYEHRMREIAETAGTTFERVYELAMDFYAQNKKGDLEVAKLLGVELTKWHNEDEILYFDASECLKRLHEKYKIGIIANQLLGTKERLEKHGVLKYIDLVISSAEEGVSKPDKRIFQIALERAGCKPEEAVMIGDRVDNDIVPAKALGMRTIWVKQGFGKLWTIESEIERPDNTVDNLMEICEIL